MKKLLLMLGFIPTMVLSQTIFYSETFNQIQPNLSSPGNELFQTGLGCNGWYWAIPMTHDPSFPQADHCLLMETSTYLTLNSPCAVTRRAKNLPLYYHGDPSQVNSLDLSCGEDFFIEDGGLTLAYWDVPSTDSLWLSFKATSFHYGSLSVRINCNGELSSEGYYTELLNVPHKATGFLSSSENHLTHIRINLSQYIECDFITLDFYHNDYNSGCLNYSFIDDIYITDYYPQSPIETETSNIDLIKPLNPTSYKMYNIAGQEVSSDYKGVIFYIYDNGYTEKKINLINL